MKVFMVILMFFLPLFHFCHSSIVKLIMSMASSRISYEILFLCTPDLQLYLATNFMHLVKGLIPIYIAQSEIYPGFIPTSFLSQPYYDTSCLMTNSTHD